MEVSSIKETRQLFERELMEISAAEKKLSVRRKALEEHLYELRISELHIAEIYRLAQIHLPRLRRVTELSDADRTELEKWITRVKDNDGRVDIVVALRELEKYQPKDITRNLYALVQKIIIEGPINTKKR